MAAHDTFSDVIFKGEIVDGHPYVCASSWESATLDTPSLLDAIIVESDGRSLTASRYGCHRP